MLVRDDMVIGQPAHAWVSGQIARAWGNAAFPAPEPSEAVCLAAYLEDQRALQARLAAGLDAGGIARGRALLRCWDSFSLALCLPRLPWRLEGVPAAHGDATIVVDGAGEAITANPWPFREDRVELECEGRRLEGRLPDEAVLHAALAEAPWV